MPKLRSLLWPLVLFLIIGPSPLLAGDDLDPRPGSEFTDLAQPRHPSGRLVPCGDGDGDWFFSTECGGDDCDDTDPEIYPGAIDCARCYNFSRE